MVSRPIIILVGLVFGAILVGILLPHWWLLGYIVAGVAFIVIKDAKAVHKAKRLGASQAFDGAEQLLDRWIAHKERQAGD